ncbi:peptidase U32 family protein [Desulfotalea psychrophila]|uniref:Related to collagenase (Proteinase) n=1 Tax=Desulfotalea psychrophila (strain LSv54 / DSM 12343) TaxID=177439 RepID=Q6AMS9_DESPS|nr:peptidase U32 family protein [Desulfotalea psychrophila]CAG36346.1 related to collagenase (proteinase) [Desulfotalea psychrophila LSv54]
MELLAPVGNIQNFHVALESGADAVYVGAPGLNARTLARDVSLEEIAAMIEYCHDRDKKLYVAANSLVLEKELDTVIDSLAILEALKPDGLIVQDMGVVRLIRDYFPKIHIHGSTLTTAHNSDSVRFMERLGCDRVVLARELTLKEIETIAQKRGKAELEVFIHGAMCFSYSGLCLFSSYLGGKSGLRGRCVQPCRRGYRLGSQKAVALDGKGSRGPKGLKGRGGQKQNVAGRGGSSRSEYLFSMNDLSGLEVVPALRDMGIASLKIEGRLRSAHYVEHIVRAYRLMMDATPENVETVLPEAQKLAEQAMSRKISPGYFLSPQPAEAISHLHSGNMGLHLGRFTKIDGGEKAPSARFRLKENVGLGDRLRLHIEPGGERIAFSLKELFGERNKSVARGLAGESVKINLPVDLLKHRVGSCDVYKVDAKSTIEVAKTLPLGSKKEEIETIFAKRRSLIFDARSDSLAEIEPIPVLAEDDLSRPSTLKLTKRSFKQSRVSRSKRAVQETNLHKQLKLPFEWWLRLDSAKTVLSPLPFTPDRFLLSLDKAMVRQASQIKKYLGTRSRQVIWALPPVVMENDLGRMRKNIQLLISSGYRSFQISNMSQLEFFGREKVHLYGDYTLNLLNTQSLMLASQIGFESVQFSIETDRENLYNSLASYRELTSAHKLGAEVPKIPIGLTVYGAPPLYTSRLASSHFNFDREVLSPKNEGFVIRKRDGFTQTYPTRPFSLIPYMRDLKELGVNYVVMDLCGSGRGSKEVEELAGRLAGGRGSKLPTFNYLGELQ